MFLTLKEIEEFSSQIQKEFKELIENELIVQKKTAKQWQFFEGCFKALFKIEFTFTCSANEARDYNYQIKKRLEKFVKDPDEQRRFVFSITHRKNLSSQFSSYPCCNKYAMRVAFSKTEAKISKEKSARKAIIKKAVSDAIDLEFEVYKKLPTDDLSEILLELQKTFDKDGSAYRKILKTLKKHNKARHTIQNKNNPSRKQLKEIEIVSFDFEKNEAKVETKEFFHLKWYSEEKGDYMPSVYRKENIQTYVLEWKGDQWMVIKNIYPERKPKIFTED